MSRCPLCGSKECCGGYYQEVQDVLVEALKGAKWLIESYVAKPERYEEYQDVVKAIRLRVRVTKLAKDHHADMVIELLALYLPQSSISQLSSTVVSSRNGGAV